MTSLIAAGFGGPPVFGEPLLLSIPSLLEIQRGVPLPVDGLPVLGHPLGVPGLYLAAMHSGVTLAPIVGHFAAMEQPELLVEDIRTFFRKVR